MPNYRLGKIYRITSALFEAATGTDKSYIGSTCMPRLSDRLASQNAYYQSYLAARSRGEQKYRLTSFDILKYDDHKITLIEEFPCDTRDQLHARERFYIQSTNCVNKCIPTRTMKEYYQDYRHTIIERVKEYYKNNCERINQKINCPCGKMTTAGNRRRHEKSRKHVAYCLRIVQENAPALVVN